MCLNSTSSCVPLGIPNQAAGDTKTYKLPAVTNQAPQLGTNSLELSKMLPSSFLIGLLWGIQEAQPAFAHPLGLDRAPPQEAHKRDSTSDELADKSQDLFALGSGSREHEGSTEGWADISRLLTGLLGLRIETGTWETSEGVVGGDRVCVDGVCWCTSLRRSVRKADGCHYMNQKVSG